ncbi:MAG: Rubredoxin [uncultured Sulfurovum sp.]|uniref:Rubredoxin n=1 Tax=uncultured Sulfurovum sp. TaxID=269237 RepID=A0A6S6TNE6_9BACT|nr:MAG: Rubredoxin [uncultured Sulfurovum sp.]
MERVDVKSEAFQNELSKTWAFVEKVNKNFSWVPHPRSDVNEGIALGLTRQKLMYGKRYCPCFMVEGETKEAQKAAKNRVCPCKPAIEVEIPRDGTCHCGIFCTQEYVDNYSDNENSDKLQALMSEEDMDSQTLEKLLTQRDDNEMAFRLIDVREEMENDEAFIIGTDLLLPTSTIHKEIKQLEASKDEFFVIYCHAGSRSAQVRDMMKGLGFNNVSSLEVGIKAYKGAIEKRKLQGQELKEGIALRQERELNILYAERDNLLRRLRVITSVVSSLNKHEKDLEYCLESIVCVVEALGNKESSINERLK